jgi:spore maturation protein CgeB
VKALARRGHRVTFLERDTPWYRDNRDLTRSADCEIHLYGDMAELAQRHGRLIATADLVMLGSFVPDGKALGDWITMTARGVTAFYDIDTPVTLANLANGGSDYITLSLIPRFDLYLSFTGGAVLNELQERYGSPRARPLYCAVDTDVHAPQTREPRWTLGYLGTYSQDRQAKLSRLLFEPARQMPECPFVVAGPQYPADIDWPQNVERREHVPPHEHAGFYSAQRYTLNVTRDDMTSRGFSPSVRLFEAAACGVPLISDSWEGLETFFEPDEEILIARNSRDVVGILRDLPEERRLAIAAAARRRILRSHTSDHRAKELEGYYLEVATGKKAKQVDRQQPRDTPSSIIVTPRV